MKEAKRDRKLPRFWPGDTIHEVFFDDDIGAWNVTSWVCGPTKLVYNDETDHNNFTIVYGNHYSEDTQESDLLFKTGLSAANAAKKLNKELNK